MESSLDRKFLELMHNFRTESIDLMGIQMNTLIPLLIKIYNMPANKLVLKMKDKIEIVKKLKEIKIANGKFINVVTLIVWRSEEKERSRSMASIKSNLILLAQKNVSNQTYINKIINDTLTNLTITQKEDNALINNAVKAEKNVRKLRNITETINKF